MPRLTVLDHDRDAAGLTYVYPVVSRRAQGVSVGINLNPNNACNWRCVYCQVPNLVRGKAPKLELAVLEAELSTMLFDIVHGDFMSKNVEAPFRRLNDIALSGNGEPSTSPQLGEVLKVIERLLGRFDLLGKIKLVMISNGSMAGQPEVQQALRFMSTMNGQVWFKFDRGTAEGLSQTNSVRMDPADHIERLKIVAGCLPTYVQTCMFALDGAPPSEAEVQAYLSALQQVLASGAPLAGVLLYGLARPSMQAEAPRLSAVPEAWLSALATRIEALGLSVTVTP